MLMSNMYINGARGKMPADGASQTERMRVLQNDLWPGQASPTCVMAWLVH